MNNNNFTIQEIDSLNDFKNKIPTDWKIEFGRSKDTSFIAFGYKDDFDNNCSVYHKFAKNDFRYYYSGPGGGFWESDSGKSLEQLLVNFWEEIKELDNEKDNQHQSQSSFERG